jgi:hypothetical protein
MSHASRSNVRYQVNRRGGRPGASLATIREGLLELERRARRYGRSRSPIFSWKMHGHRYSSRQSLGACIDGIAASAMKVRRVCEHGRWLLNISRRDTSRLTLALQEGTPFAQEVDCGTCPLKIWHREIHDHFAPLRSYGIYDCRPIEGLNEPSQHSYANAEDVHSSVLDTMRAVACYTAENAQRLSVHHVIFYREWWRSENPVWEAFPGEDDHTDHVHVDFLPPLGGKCRISQCLPGLIRSPAARVGPRRPGPRSRLS